MCGRGEENEKRDGERVREREKEREREREGVQPRAGVSCLWNGSRVVYRSQVTTQVMVV